MDDFAKCLLRYLDGTHNRQQLLLLLKGDLDKNRFALPRGEVEESASKSEDAILEEMLMSTLRYFYLTALHPWFRAYDLAVRGGEAPLGSPCPMTDPRTTP